MNKSLLLTVGFCLGHFSSSLMVKGNMKICLQSLHFKELINFVVFPFPFHLDHSLRKLKNSGLTMVCQHKLAFFIPKYPWHLSNPCCGTGEDWILFNMYVSGTSPKHCLLRVYLFLIELHLKYIKHFRYRYDCSRSSHIWAQNSLFWEFSRDEFAFISHFAFVLLSFNILFYQCLFPIFCRALYFDYIVLNVAVALESKLVITDYWNFKDRWSIIFL